MAEATASDVRVEIDTALDDPAIAELVQRIEREWQRHYTPDAFADRAHIADFEAALTALRIAEGRDRRAESASTGRTKTDYETQEIEHLQQRVRRLDPGDEFGHSAIIRRDSDRHITTPTPDDLDTYSL
jgi:hypothetical protein